MFDMVDIGHGQIMLFRDRPSAAEIEKFSNSRELELGMLYYRKQILFAFKTDTLGCVDMTYATQLTQIVGMQELHDYPEPRGGLAINLLLLDSSNGEIKDLRFLSTDIPFHRKFAEVVRDKMEGIYSRTADIKELEAIYKKYPTSEDMMKACDIRYKWS